MARRRAIRGTPPPVDPRKERAWRAVRAFRALIPQLQNFARAATGNASLRVEATAGTPRTDGATIFLQPPARLGDNVLHVRRYCNKRNPLTLRQMCEACDIDDIVEAGLHHEMAHIIFKTIEEPTPAGRAAIDKLVREWHPAGVCTHAEEMRKATEDYISKRGDSYMLRANLFDEMLGILLNAFEDARVNVSMFEYRPGTRAMLSAHATDLMSGDNQDDPNWVPWHERDVNSQILIGMFLVASEEFGYVDQLCEEAKQVLWSDEIDAALLAIGRSGTVHDTVQVTVDIFRALQDMGIMVLPKCAPPPPPEEDDDASPDEEGQLPGSPGEDSPAGEAGGDEAPGSEDEQSSPGDGTGGGGNEGDASGPPLPGDPPDGGGDSDSGDPQQGGSEDHGDLEDRPGGTPDEAELDPQSGNGGTVPDRRRDEGSEGEPGSSDDTGDRQDADKGSSVGETEEPDGKDAGGDSDNRSRESDTDESPQEEDAEAEVSDSEAWLDDAEDQESELDEASREAIRATAQGMTLHAVLSEELPECDRKQFACGESVLHPVVEDKGDDEDGIALIGWGEPDEDGNIEALLIALAQAGWFEEPSAEVNEVHELQFPSPEVGWVSTWLSDSSPESFRPAEEIIGHVTTVGRITFDENRRSRKEVNRRSGRINTRSLARRAPFGDDRLFHKRIVPGKKSYHVVITIDCSGSTAWGNKNFSIAKRGERRIDRIKRAAFAQAEVLNRLGIPFELWAHTAHYIDEQQPVLGSKMQLLQVKTTMEPWNEDSQKRLACVNHYSGNLDGHTLEFMRKRAELSNATDRIIIYYTDGAMPAMNAEEEGQILLRETEHCRKANIHLLAVGINTDSPKEWGFDTVEVRSDEDLVKVMEQLQRALSE